jgi:hypothetical protein
MDRELQVNLLTDSSVYIITAVPIDADAIRRTFGARLRLYLHGSVSS